MSETINFILWIVSIVVALLSIFCWIGMFVDTSGLKKFFGAVAAILGFVVFYYVYLWSKSIRLAMFAVSFLLYVFGTADKQEPAEKRTSQGGFGQALWSSYCQYNLVKQAHKDAERELEQER